MGVVVGDGRVVSPFDFPPVRGAVAVRIAAREGEGGVVGILVFRDGEEGGGIPGDAGVVWCCEEPGVVLQCPFSLCASVRAGGVAGAGWSEGRSPPVVGGVRRGVGCVESVVGVVVQEVVDEGECTVFRVGCVAEVVVEAVVLDGGGCGVPELHSEVRVSGERAVGDGGVGAAFDADADAVVLEVGVGDGRGGGVFEEDAALVVVVVAECAVGDLEAGVV